MLVPSTLASAILVPSLDFCRAVLFDKANVTAKSTGGGCVVDFGEIEFNGCGVKTPAGAQIKNKAICDASGNKIAIKHSDGFISYYMHLSQRSVNVGTHVAARQFIGKVGSTGRSTGPHLHFGFKNPQGQWIDPLTKTMIATPKLSGERLAKLQSQVKEIRKQIDLTLESPAVKVNDSTDVMVRMRVLN